MTGSPVRFRSPAPFVPNELRRTVPLEMKESQPDCAPKLCPTLCPTSSGTMVRRPRSFDKIESACSDPVELVFSPPRVVDELQPRLLVPPQGRHYLVHEVLRRWCRQAGEHRD